MGWGIFGNAIGGLDRQLGKTQIGRAYTDLRGTGGAEYDYGRGITDEGLTGLRDLETTYNNRLADPLGPQGNQIFARARGNLQDDFSRSTNASAARRAALAAQSGGALTQEQIDAGNSADSRSAAEGLFRGEGDLATAMAQMTLTETNKIFDRLEGIRKTKIGVGEDDKSRGLQTILGALTGNTGYNKAVISNVLGPWGHG